MRTAMLWEVDIYAALGQLDLAARSIESDAADLGLEGQLQVTVARGYLLEGDGLDEPRLERIAGALLADPVVERTVIAAVGDPRLAEAPTGRSLLVHVLRKPGVMDPVADSALQAIAQLGIAMTGVRTLQKIWLSPIPDDQFEILATKILANDAIEQVIVGPLSFDHLELGTRYDFARLTVSLEGLDDQALMALSRTGQLYLQLAEMQTIQAHFAAQRRPPTDIELETIAQTWSEHCSHKTLAGRIDYRDERGARHFENMLKETIFAATEQIRQRRGEDDWCVSVFEDNAGIVRFDARHNLVFKVETHNHPSALEPYGGANTGIGGVLRDTMGTGLGAKPIASTDVFCFAPPDTPLTELPPGVLHPRRVMKGVVAGVRDYGNRMGIPTVNGAVYFDPRYLGNPLVFCGSVGVIPQEKSHKEPHAGDWIVAIGGRTGRDGIHGATFSSAELTSQSEELSGGAVQIGNAITEKMVLDVLLAARDRDLYTAVTDCGAGGFSSAVGEMGEKIGAEVWLERAPLKYEGLNYTEIWISEAQERMVVSVPPDRWEPLAELCVAEGVEATIIGQFVPTGRLLLKYNDQVVGDLSMEFLHNGRPPVIREASYQPAPQVPLTVPSPTLDLNATLLAILASLNVASKEWVVRQYDHEVQGGSVVKPLVGVAGDGPGDAAVVRPILDSYRGVVISCGMNPYYGDIDTYHMAASAIDEAIRNCVAVGADPDRISLLDNFCWGDCERPETLGSLVRAALACYDLAVALGTPFISGKDSLNNEFSYQDSTGRQTVAIPSTLLISAMGQMDDARQAITMDLKEPGNILYQVGVTRSELGGSHFAQVHGCRGGHVPQVDPHAAGRIFKAVHEAICAATIRACHDLSEGGLAVAVAEMAFAGGLGAQLALGQIPRADVIADGNRPAADAEPAAGSPQPSAAELPRAVVSLLSESNSRFVCEVKPSAAARFEQLMSTVPHARIGQVVDVPRFQVMDTTEWHDNRDGPEGQTTALLIDLPLEQLKEAWQAPLRWG
jgi:phosphoribosylformylglycinamidine synthase II